MRCVNDDEIAIVIKVDTRPDYRLRARRRSNRLSYVDALHQLSTVNDRSERQRFEKYQFDYRTVDDVFMQARYVFHIRGEMSHLGNHAYIARKRV